MVRTCAAPGCRTGYPLKKGEANQVRPKRALFAAPKDQELLKKWQHNLPRKELKLSNSSYVCELHFLQEDIQNSYFGLCNGVPSDVIALQTVNKHLRPVAVPVLWPGCPDYLSKKEKPKRKPPKERVLPSPEATIFDNEEVGSGDIDFSEITLDPFLVADPDLTS
ncbi:uncharacterized protein LOC116922666 [Daphnia magna]|nr:uncharacterized protein LOC116922666 [Daphnia magna]